MSALLAEAGIRVLRAWPQALGREIMDLTQHLHDLPIERRLALSYAPRAAQPITLGFLALDNRLAGIVRQAREPLLGQIKLSWWRDRLNAKEQAGALGDPLLAILDQLMPLKARQL